MVEVVVIICEGDIVVVAGGVAVVVGESTAEVVVGADDAPDAVV